MTEYWFKPKQHGIGAGVPLNWKGWALFIAFVGSIIAVPFGTRLVLGYEGSVLLRVIIVILISPPFLWLAWKKTEGGWRWRRGDEDVDESSFD